MDLSMIVKFLFSVIRVSTPLIFGALAACVTKKAGLMNLAIESMMLASALAGVLVSGATQSLVLGMLAGFAIDLLRHKKQEMQIEHLCEQHNRYKLEHL